VIGEHRPDVTVVDVRMPPGYTDEGLRAAIAIHKGRVAGVLPVHRDPLYGRPARRGVGR
jgi:hypothetical protein